MDARNAGTSIAALSPERWQRLRRLAGWLSRRQDEAEDLLQDVLLAALEAGRSDDPWLQGALRRHAAFLARSAVRRHRRETLDVDWLRMAAGGGENADADAHDRLALRAALDVLLPRLPPAARRVLVLALHGLGADEIRWLLGTTRAAFRQRLTTIRRAIDGLPAATRDAFAGGWARHEASSRIDPRSGLRRRLLVSVSTVLPAAGAQDPDGHLILVRGDAHVPVLCGNRADARAVAARPDP